MIGMADMKTAILITLEHEGGFQNMATDRANWTGGKIGVGELLGTKYGITALDLPDFQKLFPGVEVPDITPDQAVVYYEKKFWNPFYAAILNQTIANKLFDMGVLFGEGTAVEILQTVLGVKIDGDFGQVSLVRTNGTTAALLLEDFQAALREHAIRVIQNHPEEAGDLKGWEARVAS